MSWAASTPATSDAMMNPTVPAAPNRPCAVDDLPAGLFAATTEYNAGFSIANPVASRRMSGTASNGSTISV